MEIKYDRGDTNSLWKEGDCGEWLRCGILSGVENKCRHEIWTPMRLKTDFHCRWNGYWENMTQSLRASKRWLQPYKQWRKRYSGRDFDYHKFGRLVCAAWRSIPDKASAKRRGTVSSASTSLKWLFVRETFTWRWLTGTLLIENILPVHITGVGL